MRRRGEQREDNATLITMETNPDKNYGSITTVTACDLISDTLIKHLTVSRKQKLRVIQSGVPQGSALEPLFFLLSLVYI